MPKSLQVEENQQGSSFPEDGHHAILNEANKTSRTKREQTMTIIIENGNKHNVIELKLVFCCGS